MKSVYLSVLSKEINDRFNIGVWADIPIMPEEISYNEKGVYIGDYFAACEFPRFYFAKILLKFDQSSIDQVKRMAYTKIGSNCTIGEAGFGYVDGPNGERIQMPHLGNVFIHNNVTIHNNVNIDRAVIGSTIIGEGTKIDSLVHIAHGAKIGKNCLIVAGSIIGGSVVIGDNCYIGMGAKIKNKVKIGKGVTVGAGAVVLKDIPDFETWVGVPAKKLEK